MKCISLWQPWASLVACGAKRFETRHYERRHRGPLLIHASLRWTKAELEAFRRVRAAGAKIPASPDRLPFGAVIAVVDLVAVHRMTPTFMNAQPELELACGLWTEGRFAWAFENVRPLRRPVPLRGRQGIFNVDVANVAGFDRWVRKLGAA